MSTTILPQKPPPLKPDFDPQELLDHVHEVFLCAYGDYDKADDWQNHEHYGGKIDAYYNVIYQMTGVEIKPGDE